HVVIEPEYLDGLPSIAGRYPRRPVWTNAGLRAGSLLIVTDVDTDSTLSDHEREAYRVTGVRASLRLGLVKNGEFVAGVGVPGAAPREWTADEVALLRETAERTWAEIQRREAEAALAEAAARDAYRILLADALRSQADPVAIRRAAARVFGEHSKCNRVIFVQRVGDDELV